MFYDYFDPLSISMKKEEFDALCLFIGFKRSDFKF